VFLGGIRSINELLRTDQSSAVSLATHCDCCGRLDAVLTEFEKLGICCMTESVVHDRKNIVLNNLGIPKANACVEA
jgi:hypothetical protein